MNCMRFIGSRSNEDNEGDEVPQIYFDTLIFCAL